jgi:hypothetical protein
MQRRHLFEGITISILALDSTVGGATSHSLEEQNAASSLCWHDLVESHQISLTGQKDGNGKPCRRACTIKSVDARVLVMERSLSAENVRTRPACPSPTQRRTYTEKHKAHSYVLTLLVRRNIGIESQHKYAEHSNPIWNKYVFVSRAYYLLCY